MKTWLLLSLLLFKPIFHTYSQIIKVIDKEDQNPVADVAIINISNTKFVYTNRSGEADISSFSNTEDICFQHFTYERICLTRVQISENNYSVSLTKKLFAFEDFVISANRWEQKRNEVPNRITMVLKPEVQLQNPQTAADLIGLSGEVFIQKSQLGGGSPMIRGFATNRILIVVDGVRMNNAIYREGNIQNIISLDPSSIESTEIIFGPGATVYGSDAIGGVMDFHTKKALYTTGEKAYIKVDAFTRFSTANKEKTGHLDFNIGGKKIAFLSGITWSDYDHLRMGSVNNPDYTRSEYVVTTEGVDSVVKDNNPDLQVYSGYSQINTINKLRIRLLEGVDISVSNNYSKLSDVPRYDRLIQYKSGKLRFAEWYYGPQEWMMNSIQADIRMETAIFDAATITAAIQNYRESRHDREFGISSVNEQYDKVGIGSLNADFDKKLKEENQNIYYGLEYFHNNVKSEAEQRNIFSGELIPAASRYPDGKNIYAGVSVYAGYKNKLNEKITLSTGARYNYVRLNSTIDDNSYYNMPFTEISLSNGALTGSGGMVVRFNEKLQINANLSTGFRAPNLDDVGKIFDPAPGIVVVPNPDLDPEYAYNADLGISRDFSGVLHIEMTAFFTYLNKAMVRHDFLFNGEDSIMYKGELCKVQALTNTSYARVAGAHMNAIVNITDYLKLKSNITITKGTEKGDIPLRHAAPLFGSTHLILKIKSFNADIYSVYNGSKKFDEMPPSETDKPYIYAKDENGNPWSPGWATLNLKLSYDIMKVAIINAGIENIIDNRYRPYSSGIAAPGRNIVLSLRVII
ncbi:MAG TPA: TonB-dependent receptor [Bacteroidales bacterium]|nr:TonB-dependent receptor [Bacteroidales bacterium]